MLKVARDLIQKLSLLCSIESALADKLEELEKAQFRIQEDHKLLKAGYDAMQKKYGELMYGFSAVKKDLPAELNSRFRDLEFRLEGLEGLKRP